MDALILSLTMHQVNHPLIELEPGQEMTMKIDRYNNLKIISIF